MKKVSKGGRGNTQMLFQAYAYAKLSTDLGAKVGHIVKPKAGGTNTGIMPKGRIWGAHLCN